MSNGNKAPNIERRKYIRYSCKTELKTIIDFNPDVARRSSGKFPPVVFRKGEHGIIRDISEKGLSIELEHVLPEGMVIKIAIENPVTPPIQTGARIMWAKKISGAKNRYVMGLAYRYMREKQRRYLESLIEFLQSIPE